MCRISQGITVLRTITYNIVDKPSKNGKEGVSMICYENGDGSLTCYFPFQVCTYYPDGTVICVPKSGNLLGGILLGVMIGYLLVVRLR